jgi:hypothetical protein
MTVPGSDIVINSTPDRKQAVHDNREDTSMTSLSAVTNSLSVYDMFSTLVINKHSTCPKVKSNSSATPVKTSSAVKVSL